MSTYIGYLNITIPKGEDFDIDGVQIQNKTDKDLHIFFKLIQDGEMIEGEITDES